MILPVVKYGHPVLRQKGVKIGTITPEIQNLIADMKETMYSARGVGLAAQQVGRAVQLTVVDVTGITDRPSTLTWNGASAQVEEFMPLVLINPEVTPIGEPVAGPEGCLSFPEIYTDIVRPGSISVWAFDESGTPIQFQCGGLLARAIQHETDHLNGILFIDRMSTADKRDLKPELESLQLATKEELKRQSTRR